MDVWVNFKNATQWQAEGIFKRFFPCKGKDPIVEPVSDIDAADGTTHTAGSPPSVPSSSTSPLPKSRRPIPSALPLLSEEELETLAKNFAAGIPEGEVSVAALQGYLLKNKSRPKECVEEVAAWVVSERELREKLKKEKEEREKAEEKERKEKEEKEEKEKKEAAATAAAAALVAAVPVAAAVPAVVAVAAAAGTEEKTLKRRTRRIIAATAVAKAVEVPATIVEVPVVAAVSVSTASAPINVPATTSTASTSKDASYLPSPPTETALLTSNPVGGSSTEGETSSTEDSEVTSDSTDEADDEKENVAPAPAPAAEKWVAVKQPEEKKVEEAAVIEETTAEKEDDEEDTAAIDALVDAATTKEVSA